MKFWLLGISALILLGGALSVSIFDLLPASTARVFKSRTQVSRLIPQGWDFFTKNPRDAKTKAYVFKNNEWLDAGVGPKAHFKNWMGWWRAPRAQLIEMAHLLKGLEEKWVRCEPGLNPFSCLLKGSVNVVRNHHQRPTLCGSIAIVNEEVIPWTWAQAKRRVQMSSKILRLEVQCS